MVTTSLAGLVIIGLVNHYGAHATAAYGAVNQVLNYIQFPALSISIAAFILDRTGDWCWQARFTGQSRTALGMNVIFTGSLIALAYLFSKYLMALFITDHSVIELGQQLLFIVLGCFILWGKRDFLHQSCGLVEQINVPMMINILTIILIEFLVPIGLVRYGA